MKNIKFNKSILGYCVNVKNIMLSDFDESGAI